jgi:hypothetical protein
MKRIGERFEKLGGMTAELSKKIGCNRATVACYIFNCCATFPVSISLQNKSIKSGGSQNSDKCLVSCTE